jgi:hypothetical protein
MDKTTYRKLRRDVRLMGMNAMSFMSRYEAEVMYRLLCAKPDDLAARLSNFCVSFRPGMKPSRHNSRAYPLLGDAHVRKPVL